MKKTLAALALLSLALVGCQPATVSTQAPPSPDKEKGIHIRTPGANVDIERNGKNGKVDVDVNRKDQSP